MISSQEAARAGTQAHAGGRAPAVQAAASVASGQNPAPARTPSVAAITADVDGRKVEEGEAKGATPHHRAGAGCDAVVGGDEAAKQTPRFAPCADFDRMGLSDGVLRGMYAYGFARPSHVQAHAIVPFISFNDVIIDGPAGVGKITAACIGLLQVADPSARSQCLLLTKNRLRATVVGSYIRKLGTYTSVRVATCTGERGALFGADGTPHVIVGSVGSVASLFADGQAEVGAVAWIVLDDLGALLKDGWRDQLEDFFANGLRNDVHVAVVCPDRTEPMVAEFVARHLHEPVTVPVEAEQPPANTHRFRHFRVHSQDEEWKLDSLRDLYGSLTSVKRLVVFVNTSRKVAWVQAQLASRSTTPVFAVASSEPELHAAAISGFEACDTGVLVTNVDKLDVAPASLPPVTALVHYDLPMHEEAHTARVRSVNDAFKPLPGGRSMAVCHFTVGAHDTASLAQVQSWLGDDRIGDAAGDAMTELDELL